MQAFCSSERLSLVVCLFADPARQMLMVFGDCKGLCRHGNDGDGGSKEGYSIKYTWRANTTSTTELKVLSYPQISRSEYSHSSPWRLRSASFARWQKESNSNGPVALQSCGSSMAKVVRMSLPFYLSKCEATYRIKPRLVVPQQCSRT
jgi:hypothetical protein